MITAIDLMGLLLILASITSFALGYTVAKQNKARCFVKHIEKHLDEMGIEGQVMCKICDKTINEIWDEEK